MSQEEKYPGNFNWRENKRKILKEQSDSLNHIDNNYLFGSDFENEFSKSVNTKQKIYISDAGPTHISPQSFSVQLLSATFEG